MVTLSHEFEVPITDLDAGGKEFRFPIRPAWLRGALEDHEATTTGKEGELVFRASKTGEDVLIHGILHAELNIPCARCLNLVTFEVHSNLSVLMIPAHTLKTQTADEYELSSEDADTFPYEGETVVLDTVVRDEFVLETPMIPLCSEECQGISPSSSISSENNEKKSEEIEIDSRLLPLLKLKGTLKD